MDPATRQAIEYLQSPAAIRERCGRLCSLAEADRLEHFRLAPDRLDAVAERVEAVTRAAYPDLVVPYHSRWRHFATGGVDRAQLLEARLPADPGQAARARFDLVVTSVLLDAGAGPDWGFVSEGQRYTRSEGLAVASFEAFLAGRFSSDPADPLRADADGLRALDAAALAAAFQVDGQNPLVGLEGRAALLRRLGQLAGRPAQLFDDVTGGRAAGEIDAEAVLRAVLQRLGPIWPGRVALGGVSLGDVWPHPALAGAAPGSELVPFHKLSQWLTYSLLETLERSGWRIRGVEALTGLPEYRNGGLLVDLGLLVPKHDELLRARHAPGSPQVVEWRALTVALLDRVADAVRERLGVTADAFPLAKVLEGGTWAAGRAVARELREDGSPPIRIESDGTVF